MPVSLHLQVISDPGCSVLPATSSYRKGNLSRIRQPSHEERLFHASSRHDEQHASLLFKRARERLSRLRLTLLPAQFKERNERAGPPAPCHSERGRQFAAPPPPPVGQGSRNGLCHLRGAEPPPPASYLGSFLYRNLFRSWGQRRAARYLLPQKPGGGGPPCAPPSPAALPLPSRRAQPAPPPPPGLRPSPNRRPAAPRSRTYVGHGWGPAGTAAAAAATSAGLRDEKAPGHPRRGGSGPHVEGGERPAGGPAPSLRPGRLPPAPLPW